MYTVHTTYTVVHRFNAVNVLICVHIGGVYVYL